MALILHNTLGNKDEVFKPIKEGEVGLYTCGPTVYNYPHIGNYRAYIFGDILKRFLIYKGYKVNHIMNITDIDDKTIRDSKIQGKSLKELTTFYTEEFFKDRDILNILPATKYTKATEYINEMVHIIEILLLKGFAYKSDDGSIYFDIKKDKEYGKLVNLEKKSPIDSEPQLNNLEKKFSRINSDEYEKDNAQDFALWKAWDKNDGEVFWETPLGKGRPGWHIECSAMSMHELGETFDIHTGGVDNIFPHHENEIAQSECATGKTFANYFLHNEHLLVDGQKMSKSTGNFYTLQDLIKINIDPIAFRYWIYTSQYGTKTNFTIEAVKGCEVALNRLKETFQNLESNIGSINENYKNRMIESMDNNLDTPKAITILWDLVRDTTLSKEDRKATLLDFDNIFGFDLDKIKEEIIPEEIKNLADEREKARQEKNWTKGDELREKINLLGYEVKDTDSGSKISKI